jgi:hypothetical protein
MRRRSSLDAFEPHLMRRGGFRGTGCREKQDERLALRPVIRLAGFLCLGALAAGRS